VVGQDGALGDHWHAVGPAVQLLLHSVPARENTKQKIHTIPQPIYSVLRLVAINQYSDLR
jgi:hypothetical protein